MSKAVVVKIAILKSKLSEYIKKARNGQEIVVYDRDTPVVLLVPYPSQEKPVIEVIPPEDDPGSIGQIKGRSFGKGKKTSLEILLEDRE